MELMLKCHLFTICLLLAISMQGRNVCEGLTTVGEEEMTTEGDDDLPTTTSGPAVETVVMTAIDEETTITVSTTTQVPSTTTTISPTSLPTDTTTTPPTTTTPTPEELPDSYAPDLSDKVFRVPMFLAFSRMFISVELDNTESTVYMELSFEIELKVALLFTVERGAPGGFRRAAVRNFMKREDFDKVNSSANAFMLNFNESTTVAEYDIEYRMTSLNTSGDVDSLFDFLVANFTESMNTEKIDGEKVDAAFAEEHSGYLQSTTKDTIQEQVKDPCTAEVLCPSCYNCVTLNEGTENRETDCNAKCLSSENQACSITSLSGPPECLCADKYLSMAGSCVNQNIIIGVFAGVGGALVIGLLVGVIVMCASRNRDGKHAAFASDNNSMIGGKKYKSSISDWDSGLTNPTYVHNNYDSNSEAGFSPPLSHDVNPMVTMLQDTDAFKNFKPSLEHIDPNADYSISRPSSSLMTSPITDADIVMTSPITDPDIVLDGSDVSVDYSVNSNVEATSLL